MCQHPDSRRPNWHSHKSMKDQLQLKATRHSTPKTGRMEKRQSRRNGTNDENVLKRQRTVEVQSNNHVSPQSQIQARVPAYHCHRSGEPSPLSQNLQNSSNIQTEIEKRLSPAPSKRLDECSSPPAKLPMALQPSYAGAKFHDPPSPNMLPKPPKHWVKLENFIPPKSCDEMTSVIKVMLKVQC